jgi:hypothetical protein
MAQKPDTLPPRSNGKHPGGRPTKRTPQLVKRLANAIAQGLPDAQACDMVRISVDTLWAWKHDPEFKEFSEVIKQAVAKRLFKRLERIDAGEPGWQGAAWIVERRLPQDFCKPEVQLTQTVLVQNSAPPCQQIRLVTVPAAEFDKLLAKPSYTLQPDGTLQRIIGTLRVVVSREEAGDNLLTNGN